MAESLMQVRDLKVYFPVVSGVLREVVGHIKAVDGVDFNLAKGEVLGIVGETGSGKSTLGRAVLRLIEPTSGEIYIENEDLLKMPPKELSDFRKEAQIVFQDPYASLNPRKSILECIGEGPLYHGMIKSRQQQKDRVAEILELVGLPADAMWRYPHQFSGGQQQRICIGRAIAFNPKLIVCDEAASALDVSVQAQILNLLQSLKQTLGLSYLFISHDLSLIRYLCDRVLVLYLGKVMEVASVKALFEDPRHPYTQALLAAIPKKHPGEVKERQLLKGEIPSARHPPSGCPFRTRCPYALPVCAGTPPRQIVRDIGTGKMDHEYNCIIDWEVHRK